MIMTMTMTIIHFITNLTANKTAISCQNCYLFCSFTYCTYFIRQQRRRDTKSHREWQLI